LCEKSGSDPHQIRQSTAFPNAAYDDMADMMTKASAWLLRANWPTVSVSTVYL
jgi:phage terminase large subunit-like protein